MKAILSIFLVLLARHSISQDLFVYRDTVNNFSVGLPKGWTYQEFNNATTSIKLTVFRSKDTETETPRETFNVNILHFPNSDIGEAYSSMLKSISARTGYRLISEGDTTIEGRKYKWLIEQHSNIKSNETMTAFIYLGYKDGLAYMITFATITPAFEKNAALFRQISTTFKF
jgi:hypothetical protein